MAMNRLFRLAWLLGAVSVWSCAESGADDSATLRGDRSWARGDYEEALAEYRLAVRQGSSSGAAHLRVAHAYVQLQRVDEAKEAYRRAIDAEPRLVDQALADFVRLARTALVRNDRSAMTSALEAAAEFQPSANFTRLALPLALYYAENGEHARALLFFQRALAADSTPSVFYETALAYEEVGACANALHFFGLFVERTPVSEQADAGWHIGKCSHDLSREHRQAGDYEGALALVAETIAQGEPRSQLAQAHYEMAELLVATGRCFEAIGAFRAAAREDPSTSRVLARQAERWIDELRFGPPRPRPVRADPAALFEVDMIVPGPPGWAEDLEWQC